MRILHRIRHAIAWAVMPECMRTTYVLGLIIRYRYREEGEGGEVR